MLIYVNRIEEVIEHALEPADAAAAASREEAAVQA
jgi:hypothetical protein